MESSKLIAVSLATLKDGGMTMYVCYNCGHQDTGCSYTTHSGTAICNACGFHNIVWIEEARKWDKPVRLIKEKDNG